MDTKRFKERLEEELSLLTKELKSIGQRNPNNPNDWEAKPQDGETNEADANLVADRVEGLSENTAILADLENRYNNVRRALEKIEKGTYGICEISGEKIEEDRLEANPAARTSKAHMEEEGSLPL